MYELSNSEHILISGDLLKVKSQGQTPPPKKIEEHLFQATIDMHVQNYTKAVGGPLLAALAATMCSLLLPNCEALHSVRFIFSLKHNIHNVI